MNLICGRGYVPHLLAFVHVSRELLISLNHSPLTAVRSWIHGNFHLAFAFVLSFLPSLLIMYIAAELVRMRHGVRVIEFKLEETRVFDLNRNGLAELVN
jgi:hypothetical protein